MNAKAKSRQFCSVCKEWLEMEVVPTSDGDEDDGVIWFRCPQCQGFLPKLRGRDTEEQAPDPKEMDVAAAPTAGESGTSPGSAADDDDALPWDSPAAMMAAMQEEKVADPSVTDEEEDDPLLGAAEVEAGKASPQGKPEDKSPASGGGLPGVAADEVDSAPDLDGDLALAPDDDDTDYSAASSEGEGADGPSEPEEPLHEYVAMLAALDPETAVSYRPWGTYEVGQCIHHLAWDDCGVVVAKEALPGKRMAIKVFFEEAGVVRLIEQAPR